VAADPSRVPGYTYELPQAQASAVVNAAHLRGQPLVLALGIAAAAAISLALTVLGLVRRRRHELALLKTLGMTRGQVRGVVTWQTTLTCSSRPYWAARSVWWPAAGAGAPSPPRWAWPR
jgi:hypothetical protein